MIFTVDNVFGMVMARELEVADVDAIRRQSERIVQRTGARGYCVYIYYTAGLAIPSAEVREATAALTRASSHVKLLARALVIPGSGFWASALQGMYTAMTAISSIRFPQRFCANEAEAAAFLAPFTSLSPAALEGALDEARRSTAQNTSPVPA
jgi:hypothetical protein